MKKIHTPVLLDETIQSLNIKPNGFYIDCTLGDGGHSYKILSRLSSSGLLLSIDQDNEAIEFVKNFYKIPKNWIIAKGNFSNIKNILGSNSIDRKPNGILMDLGLSSRQLEDSKDRGFSYLEEDEPLDMRMDKELGVTALDLLKVLREDELTKLFKVYGEEKFAKQIARIIKENISEIRNVGDLTRLIYKVVPATLKNKNPSRRVFQALRIAVNDEINSLKIGLDQSFEILTTDGRLSIISFHSLEDRMVKKFFNSLEKENRGEIIYKKPITANDNEIEKNPRSSSAKLRSIQKVK